MYDVDGDGLNDIITSNAHGYGIFWYEQVRDGEKVAWKQHTIDDTWTQAHSLVLADLDGCGVPELITGKRFMAHNGGDPDEYGKLGLYYYKLIRKPGKTVEWKKYVISYDKGIGAGLAIWAGDFRGAARSTLSSPASSAAPCGSRTRGSRGNRRRNWSRHLLRLAPAPIARQRLDWAVFASFGPARPELRLV